MSAEKEKIPKLQGFAGIINNLINVAKEKEECKDFIRGLKTRVLLNNKEDKWAALITIKNDQIKVEGINKEEYPKFKKRKTFRYYGYWEFPNLKTMTTASGWKLGKWIRKMTVGTVRGASQIAVIGQVLAYAAPKKEPLKLKT